MLSHSSRDKIETVYQEIGQPLDIVNRELGNLKINLNVTYQGNQMRIIAAYRKVMSLGSENLYFWILAPFIPFGQNDVNVAKKRSKFMGVVVMVYIHDHPDLVGR